MEEEKYMQRCIELARNGLCNVSPNPMVGAVIVHNGRIIGEGYHIRCGQAHAEVNAIRSAGPPPTVPSVRPSKNTSIFPFLRGTLPDASAMVTTAYASPARCASSCACKSSSMRPPPRFFSSSYHLQRKIARDAALSNFALDKRAPCRYNKYAFERGGLVKKNMGL